MKKLILFLFGALVAFASFGQGTPISASTIKMYTTPNTNAALTGVVVWNPSTKLLEQRPSSGIGTPISLGTDAQMPYMNSGGTDFSYTSNLRYTNAIHTLRVGNNITLPASSTSGGYSIAVGEANTVSGRFDWCQLFGDVWNITSPANNVLFCGTSSSVLGPGATRNDAYVSINNSTFTIGSGTETVSNMYAGSNHTVTTSGTSNNLRFNFLAGALHTLVNNTGGAPREGNFIVGRYGEVTNGNGGFVGAWGTATRTVKAPGLHAINISTNDNSQGATDGSRADQGAIIGGINVDIDPASTGAACIGCNGVKIGSGFSYYTWVDAGLAINTTPDNDDDLTEILARDASSKKVKYIDRDALVLTGTYTPSLTNSINISSSTPTVCNYSKVLDMVTVSGSFSLSATASSATTRLYISLPIASNLATRSDCAGNGSSSSLLVNTSYGAILADTSGDQASFEFVPSSTSSTEYGFMFQYKVIP